LDFREKLIPNLPLLFFETEYFLYQLHLIGKKINIISSRTLPSIKTIALAKIIGNVIGNKYGQE